MLEFLLALLTTAAVGALLVPLLRPKQAPAPSRLDNDLAIYRDQLAELEREQAAGALGEAEAAQARTEIERRILSAADKAEVRRAAGVTSSESGVSKYLAPALCLIVPLFALGIYLQQGRPRLPASPFASHTPPAPGEQRQVDLAQLIAETRARLAARPDDAEALSSLGELLTAEAQGTVTPPALDAFARALKLAPGDARAAYYLGLHEAQSGDSKAALARWQALAAASPADAPFLPMLRAEIERVAKLAGVPPPEIRTLPAAGPTPDQVEQMGRLPPEERQKTIRAMVDGLAAKLEANPQDRDGWLRLANARKVLGDNDKAADAYARADAIQPLDSRGLADWAEALVRQLKPGDAPPPGTVAVLQRLEQAEPRNALALFYLGAADFAEGRKEDAARRWKTLLGLLPADAPIRPMLEAKIREAEGG